MNENQTIQTPAISETKPHRSIGSVLRWLLAIILAFGLGALIIAVLLYFPTRQQLGTASATLTSQADQITTLQASNQTLQKDMDSAKLHSDVLKALSGVRGASQAVAADDYAGARMSLIQASDALDVLSSELGADQKDVLTAMQQSAAQALTELKTSLISAQPELDQLTNNLVQLENNLFPKP
jgi:hypothetical protein